ncbi:helix-turn-helix domain-containing protein [Halomonas organivorans]|uniref:Transcriptional regulator with XRE-family HTH domain n=1 Tax=Halomonas organivorans TaxID=257772 RepID=A0A7W5C2G3_9GAMM|nr:helix-turn-helix domain-containing protein [Halomonas organivorans]MBB3143519.1 transcriptional regulator with XRE-family HTH domain [Halomonas organivorans]
MPSATQLQGSRIRSLRKLKGMTLIQLAKKTGLSHGYLSQIERGLSQPSIASLVDIAQALGVTMQWLFSESQEGSSADQGERSDMLVRKHQRVEIQYQDGIVDQLLTPRSNNNLEVIYSTYPSGTRSEPYSHKGHEAVLVLQGSLEIDVADERYVLEEGDCLSFTSSEPHAHRNLSNGEAIAVWFVTPASF